MNRLIQTLQALLIAFAVVTTGCISRQIVAATQPGPPTRSSAHFNLFESDSNQVTLDGFSNTPDKKGESLTLVVLEQANKAEIAWHAREKPIDLSAYEGVSFTVRNMSQDVLTVKSSLWEPEGKGVLNVCEGAAEILPGETGEVKVLAMRRPEDPTYAPLKPFYMYFKNIRVRDNTVNPANLYKLQVSIVRPKAGQSIEILSIKPFGSGAPLPKPFFPFIDQYGQYLHTDWPGKIYTNEDFARNASLEEKERITWPGPSDRDQYGGWKEGPTLKSTGYFYAAKHEGKWWLVDPDGKLFWSYGPTGVGFGGDSSPINDRQHWFSSLPDQSGPFGRFYRTGHGARYMYYENRDWTGFDFAQANLVRKYGDDYQKKVAELSHLRLRSWGFNTMANWSSMEIAALQKTPYVVPIHYGSRMIHPQMPDVFDPNWEKNLRNRMQQESGKTAGDPWNIGYFVDNERWFGWRPRGACIGEEVIKNSADTPMKIKFAEQLTDKYKTIDSLNHAWGTNFESWDAFLQSRAPMDFRSNHRYQDDTTRLGLESLKSNDGSELKRLFIAFLNKKYKDKIEDLNTAWKSNYQNWDDIKSSISVPDVKSTRIPLYDCNEFAEEIFKSDSQSSAKVHWVAQLKEKYKTIDALNLKWETKFENWDALQAGKISPDFKSNTQLLIDCGDLGMKVTEIYFRTCHDVVKSVAPNQMYLGSRFHGSIDVEIFKIAARYADVVAYNMYDIPPNNRVNQYRSVDAPIMITEWGVGSDPVQTPMRGNDGGVSKTPEIRAEEMTRFLNNAITLPTLVGAHFFQFRDQPLSGRPDGEATLRGFVNIADTPNFELVGVSRAFGYKMYENRSQAK